MPIFSSTQNIFSAMANESNPPLTVEYLIVAGGGGGGFDFGGGGGAGGFLTGTSTLIAQTYGVTIGGGGSGASSNSSGNGGNSSIFSIVSVGGGGGANGSGARSYGPPKTGGSGGGGGGWAQTQNAGAAGTAGQGFAGGNGRFANDVNNPGGGGGGGGASQVGFSSPSTTAAGNGGSGLSSSISGTSLFYGGGGGGGSYSNGTRGLGGSGVGGNGATGVNQNGSPGATNRGGGGGANSGGGGGSGGSGGSGIIIIKYPEFYSLVFSSGVTQTTSTLGGFKTTTITATSTTSETLAFVNSGSVGLLSSNPATSPQQLQDFSLPAGVYWIKSPSMSSAIQMRYEPNYFESKPWVRVFSSLYSSTATVNLLGNSINWSGILVQRSTLDIRHTAHFTTSRLYNTDSSTTISSSGTRTGFRVFLGGAGSHGIYNTSQSPCNWGDSINAVGAGWNGSTCGSFPNGLIWGTGQSGTPTYTNLSGTWEHWIYWS